MEFWVCEDGENVFEENAWSREIGELAERGTELYRKTGEFGGAGGGGGGESSFGGIVGGGGMVIRFESGIWFGSCGVGTC